MGLFSDIYNTVAKFFRTQEDGAEGETSKSVATNRLKLVLMQDRTNLTPKILEQMRGELIDLLSKYVELDKELLELNFEQEGNQVALMLSIPVIRAKDEEEIEAAIKAAQEETNIENADITDETEDNITNEEENECDINTEDTDSDNIELIDNSEQNDTVSNKKKKVSAPDEMSNTGKTDNNSDKEECHSEQ